MAGSAVPHECPEFAIFKKGLNQHIDEQLLLLLPSPLSGYLLPLLLTVRWPLDPYEAVLAAAALGLHDDGSRRMRICE